jgi:hypothetical protein
MTDGHCATTSEVIFVDSSASACATGDGTSANPVCTLTAASGLLHVGRNVIVLLGVASDHLTLSTSGVSPVLIGRKNSSGDVGSIPAGGGVALTILSDTALVRDLTVAGGVGSGAKGVLVQGTGTKLTLLRVTANLTTGLGVEADTGTTLTMNACTVSNNSMGGGILLNGAAFDIESTTVTGNGPSADLTWGGIKIQSPIASEDTLNLVTVQNNLGPGVSCSAPVAGTGVLASGNATGQIAGTCGFSSCGTAGPMCGAQ